MLISLPLLNAISTAQHTNPQYFKLVETISQFRTCYKFHSCFCVLIDAKQAKFAYFQRVGEMPHNPAHDIFAIFSKP
jgi:hypothetical protein